MLDSLFLLSFGAACGYALCAFLSSSRERTPDPPPQPCEFHQYAAIDAQRSVEGTSTLVLTRCTSCQAHNVTILPGHWTIEQLIRVEALPSVENRVLERMGRL